MNWFETDETGRPLSTREREFLAAVVSTLEEVRPLQLDPAETALAAEGPGRLILLMPHRGLGGVSIVLWLDDRGVAVTWAQVAHLWCCHDTLDDGVLVAEFPLELATSPFDRILQCIREQLTRGIMLKVYGSSGVLLLPDSKGRLKSVGELGTHLSWRRLWRRVPDQVLDVRFTDERAPMLSEPSGANTWFTCKR